MATMMSWTKVQKEPKEAALAAEQHDVIVERRDAPNLVLGSEERRDQQVKATALLGRLYTYWGLEDRLVTLARELPWVTKFPEETQKAFLADFIDAIRLGAEFNQLELISYCVGDWRATAQAYNDPELYERLRRPLAGGTAEVGRPTAD